jgi:predicted dienelactone hydrolase
VLLAHGFGGSRLNYEYLTVHLASWGFVVAAPSFPRANINTEPVRDLAFLGRVFRDENGPARPLAAHVRRRGGTGLVGHSLGTVAALDGGRTDPTVAAVVVLAPIGETYHAGDFAGGRPAILVLAGTADTTTVFERQAAYLFGLLPPPAALVKITGGTHSGFTDSDSLLMPAGLARQQGVTIRYALAFLKRYVARDPCFGRFLRAADPPRYAAGVELTAHLR